MTKPRNLLPTLPHLLAEHGHPLIHRDVSWLQFNDRVLSSARSDKNPIVSRLRFLSITSSNLDEFFMIRVASLLRSFSSTKTPEKKERLAKIYQAVLTVVRTLGGRQARVLDLLRKVAAEQNIFIHYRLSPGSSAFAKGREIFIKSIIPQLNLRGSFSFEAISELHNLQLLAYVSKDIWFEIPRTLPQVFLQTEGNATQVFFLDDLLISHLDQMIPVKDKPGILRVTRDADVTAEFPDNDPAAIPDIVRSTLKKREKGQLVRIQWAGSLTKEFLSNMSTALRIDPLKIFAAGGTLSLHGLFGATDTLASTLSAAAGPSPNRLKTSVPFPFEKKHKTSLFEAIDAVDFMLHHPYDSFEAFLVWLERAVEDGDVQTISQTIYRTDSDSPIVALLKKAAANGKKVRVVLELRARFDESNNLQIAEELARAGVEVKFGFGALKLHAKITLITRRRENQTYRYTHLSTGNYNVKTARVYTDISILTANKEIGIDAEHFFDSVFRQEIPTAFTHLVMAPIELHGKLRSLIKQEIEHTQRGNRGEIFAKVNALVDEKLIEDLYAASTAGVKIELVVRGACSLIPGIRGLSENIRVVSIIDRYLEHSRIYYFKQSKALYLSSADWMPRNFFSRLEIAFPVLDKRLYTFMEEVLIPAYLKDNEHATKLTSRGTWIKESSTAAKFSAQRYFEELAVSHYVDTPLEDHKFFQLKK